jgi:NAD dependent epimerase/dehydratase
MGREEDNVNWLGKNVLVTGAAGFIGSHLTETLVSRGANVTAFVRYNSEGAAGWLDGSSVREDIKIVSGDIRDYESIVVAMTGVDVVLHLAALIGIPYSYEAPNAYVETNVRGTLNILQAGRALETERIVHTSTSETYGSALRVPIDEEHPYQGQSPYSATKIGADVLAQSFFLSFGLPVVTVRPFNTYGPRQSARAVIPTIISQALGGDQIRLGSLTPTRDLNFVLDTVEGFIAAAAAGPEVSGEVINLGNGKEISIGDLASKICKLLGRDIPVVCDSDRLRPEGSEVDRLCADASKAAKLLGWTPGHSLDEGLERTIAWMRDNLDRFRVGTYMT